MIPEITQGSSENMLMAVDRASQAPLRDFSQQRMKWGFWLSQCLYWSQHSQTPGPSVKHLAASHTEWGPDGNLVQSLAIVQFLCTWTGIFSPVVPEFFFRWSWWVESITSCYSYNLSLFPLSFLYFAVCWGQKRLCLKLGHRCLRHHLEFWKPMPNIWGYKLECNPS